MAEAKASLETAEMEQEPETDDEAEDIPEETTDAQLRQTFVEEIVLAGYDRALAERALYFVSADDVDEGKHALRLRLHGLMDFVKLC